MSRLDVRRTTEGTFGFFLCPGCREPHMVRLEDAEHGWKWNGSTAQPTLHPSVRVSTIEHEGRPSRTLCHSWIRDGRISFLADCEHALAGKSADLPHIPADGVVS